MLAPAGGYLLGQNTGQLYMEFVIMCGGYYEHFDRPKALCVVGGETIIARTLRLLKDIGISEDYIHITATDPRFNVYGVDVLKHTNTYRYEGGKLKGYWLDAFYPLFPADTKVTYLYGDVVYTREALETIVRCDRPGNILFGTRKAKNRKHENKGEPFAYKVDCYPVFLAGIEAVKRMYDAGQLVRHPITWELYRYLNGLDVNVQAVLDDTYICIDDGTIDIDDPSRIPIVEAKL